MLHQLHLLFVNLDILRKQVVATLPDSSVFVNASGDGGNGSFGSSTETPLTTPRANNNGSSKDADVSSPRNNASGASNADTAAAATAANADDSKDASSASGPASSSTGGFLSNAAKRLPRGLLLYALRLFFPQKTETAFNALIAALDLTFAAIPAAASDYSLLLKETRGNCETEFVATVRSQHAFEIKSFTTALKEQVMVFARPAPSNSVASNGDMNSSSSASSLNPSSSSSSLAVYNNNNNNGNINNPSGSTAQVVRLHDIRDRWMRADPLAPLSTITATIARALACPTDLLDGSRLVAVEPFFRSLHNSCFVVPTLNFDPSAVETVSGWLKHVTIGCGLPLLNPASASTDGNSNKLTAGAGATSSGARAGSAAASLTALSAVSGIIDRVLRGSNAYTPPPLPVSAVAAATGINDADSNSNNATANAYSSTGGNAGSGGASDSLNRRRSLMNGNTALQQQQQQQQQQQPGANGNESGARVVHAAGSSSGFFSGPTSGHSSSGSAGVGSSGSGSGSGGAFSTTASALSGSMFISGIPDLVVTPEELAIFHTDGVFGPALNPALAAAADAAAAAAAPAGTGAGGGRAGAAGSGTGDATAAAVAATNSSAGAAMVSRNATLKPSKVALAVAATVALPKSDPGAAAGAGSGGGGSVVPMLTTAAATMLTGAAATAAAAAAAGGSPATASAAAAKAAAAAAAARRAKLLQQAQSQFTLVVARTRQQYGLPRLPRDELPVVVLPRYVIAYFHNAAC